MDIKSILIESLKTAVQMQDAGKIPMLVNRNRSKHFVETMASLFRKEFENSESVRVFSKHDDRNRGEFGLNELLFDVLVCETNTVPSATNGQTLRHITRAIWQIESEFANDTREAIYDFNKLVLGASENKLFVGPQVSKEKDFLDPLGQAAKWCNSHTYVALIPHPDRWPLESPDVHLWKYDGRWQPA